MRFTPENKEELRQQIINLLRESGGLTLIQLSQQIKPVGRLDDSDFSFERQQMVRQLEREGVIEIDRRVARLK